MFSTMQTTTLPAPGTVVAQATFSTTVQPDGETRAFPPFSLARLLHTVFTPRPGERVCVLIDLPDPAAMRDLAFLKNPALTIQAHAYRDFHLALRDGGVMAELDLRGGEMFAFKATGGSNLDLPDLAVDVEGRELSLERDIYSHYDLVLCISTYSATAPLTAFAKRFGFRGATLHGVNDLILKTGLAVNYEDVSREAEVLRRGLTKADAVEIDYEHAGKPYSLRLLLGGQEAQKSHGLCRGGPDVANLPAGEVYFVPESAEGSFPHRYEDGTISLMTVKDGYVVGVDLLTGNEATVAPHRAKIMNDRAAGFLGELGFGTQRLPVSGRDIQDEKILGTFHVATGRSDHLGGHITPPKFIDRNNATHDDILFSPTKTPEIHVRQVRMERDGKTFEVIRDYRPGSYLREIMANG